ncbi:MAG TPA: outer membrane lipoprotein carrier protein LolA [Steroidobacteraceae bacterium]
MSATEHPERARADPAHPGAHPAHGAHPARAGAALGATCALLWALVMPATCALAAANDLDRVMSALAGHQHGRATFVEHKYLAVLDGPLESSGELLFDAPDHLEKRTLKPKPETLVLDGSTVQVQRGRHRYELDLQQYPQVVPFIESIRATLAGDRGALERVFRLEFQGSFEHWTLRLTPRDATLAHTVRQIQIDGRADLIHTVTIMETDGDHSVLSIAPEAAP